MDDFEDMPNHFFTTVNENAGYHPSFDLSLAAAFEMGLYLRKQSDNNLNYRLSVFCDYGLKNIHSNSEARPLILNKYDEPYFEPTLNSFIFTDKSKVNPFYAGIKLTIILGIQKQEPCNCEGYIRDNKRTKRTHKALPWGRY